MCDQPQKCVECGGPAGNGFMCGTCDRSRRRGRRLARASLVVGTQLFFSVLITALGAALSLDSSSPTWWRVVIFIVPFSLGLVGTIVSVVNLAAAVVEYLETP